MLSTLEPASPYSAFNLNLVSELAPLYRGAGAVLCDGVRLRDLPVRDPQPALVIGLDAI